MVYTRVEAIAKGKGKKEKYLSDDVEGSTVVVGMWISKYAK